MAKEALDSIAKEYEAVEQEKNRRAQMSEYERGYEDAKHGRPMDEDSLEYEQGYVDAEGELALVGGEEWMPFKPGESLGGDLGELVKWCQENPDTLEKHDLFVVGRRKDAESQDIEYWFDPYDEFTPEFARFRWISNTVGWEDVRQGES